MSLPPGFLDELRTRLSLAQVVGRKVMWDNRKSNQAKGDMWAPCPFHQEKTASFHVDDRKGFYYCFGCHAKGDAIGFVRETENVDFIEAVRILAAEAGMPMPERDPQAQEKADRRGHLSEVMEQAARFFGMQLRSGAGAAARAYLNGRGLSPQVQERFGIGYAPEGWQGLWDHLTGQGVAPEMILACGLARESDRGGRPYDVFRDRIMFPIRDARGRCIAFGGRAMDPNDRAKYLNSPETELFDKSRTLYNLGPAREAAGKGQPLIVAEGYMDVIALVAAGFEAAVAPLGTAVTEDQVQLLWRMAEEPVIMLDGDRAGLGAAYRLVDLALPLLEAGRTLRFARMPEGKDPDDLLRAEGPRAVQARVDAALPLVRLLWQRETEARSFDTPERKAALERVCREKTALIRDPALRGYYERELKDLRWQLFNPRRAATRSGSAARGRKSSGKWTPPEPARVETRNSVLVSGDPAQAEHLREAVILATLICCPEVVEEFESEIERMRCRGGDHAGLRAAILRHAGAGEETLRAQIADEMGEETLDKLLAQPHVSTSIPMLHRGDREHAFLTLREEFAKLLSAVGKEHEMSEALEDFAGVADETITWRLGQATDAWNRANRSALEDDTEYVVAENGLPLDKKQVMENRAFWDSLETMRPKKQDRES